jgi:lysophospholipase L1-like esterase
MDSPKRNERKPLIRVGRLSASVVVVLLLAGFVKYFWLYWPMGSGPAGASVPREPFTRTWSTRPVVLLGLGDSVTDGYGASLGHSYFDRLVENPPDEFPDMRGICLKAVFPKLIARNWSISGSTSIQLREGQLMLPEKERPDVLGVVVITTGGNDIIHDYGRGTPREGAMYGATLEQARPWIANFEKRLDEIVRILERRFPGGCHIFLANIYDPTDGVGTAGTVGLPAWRDGLKILTAYNEVIARCAERHASVREVDMRGALLGHGIYCRQFWRPYYHPDDPTYWYHENFEDPNDRGYDAVRRVFLLEMARALAEGRGDVRH